MAELIDITDERDQLTGRQTTVAAAHKDGLWHRVAVVYVFTADGRLLVQVRNEPGYRRDHTVGGHVDTGESYEQAARREMQEEIALDAPLRFVTTAKELHQYAPEVNVAHLHSIFEAHAPDDWEFTPNDEVTEIIPMSLDEIVADMQANPDMYMYGFMKTIEAYMQVRGDD